MTALKSDSTTAKRAMLAVLYAEIRGFTRMSEILEPAVVIARVAEFFAMVTAAVEGHEGRVCSKLNDNVVATFAGAAGALHAIEAAQQIQRDFNAIEEAWQRDYGFRTAVAMGLHCGDVVVGGLASPVSPQVLTIGDGLSLAERLLHRARAGEFVMSKVLLDTLVSSGGSIEAEPLPALKISKREPLQIYGVLLDTRLDFTD